MLSIFSRAYKPFVYLLQINVILLLKKVTLAIVWQMDSAGRQKGGAKTETENHLGGK